MKRQPHTPGKTKLLGRATITLTAIALLAACSSPPSTGPTAAAFPSTGSGTLHLYNFTDYIAPSLLTRFTAETGIKVTVDTYDSNETMLAKLQSGNPGYDVVVPTDYMVDRMIKLGLLQKVDAAGFPNGANITTDALNVYYDKGRQYTAPYMTGTTAATINTKLLSTPVTSWKEFFNPPADAVGKIGVLADQTEVVNAALYAVGAKACSDNPDDYAKAEALLKDFKPKVRVISSDGVHERVAAGETVLQMQYSGGAHKSFLQNKDTQYTYMSDGTDEFFDNLAIPTGAPDLDNAKIFLNWMMTPKNIAEESNFNAYGNGITGADQYLTPEVKNDPAVTPPDSVKKSLTLAPACSPAAVASYSQVWTAFRG